MFYKKRQQFQLKMSIGPKKMSAASFKHFLYSSICVVHYSEFCYFELPSTNLRDYAIKHRGDFAGLHYSCPIRNY